MVKLILKSPYIKNTGNAGGYLKYIGTRKNVEMVSDARPPTKRQTQLINKLLLDFPDCKNSYEYSDYHAAPTKVNASALITMALESNWEAIQSSEVYMKYIATRPRAERFGSHGLFGDEDNVDMAKAMQLQAADKMGSFMDTALPETAPTPPEPPENSGCKVIPFEMVG